jgi:hypothetical protein
LPVRPVTTSAAEPDRVRATLLDSADAFTDTVSVANVSVIVVAPDPVVIERP